MKSAPENGEQQGENHHQWAFKVTLPPSQYRDLMQARTAQSQDAQTKAQLQSFASGKYQDGK